MRVALKVGFMRTGSSEIAPFGGSTLLSSVEEMASTKTSPSSGLMMADGMLPCTAVGFCVVLIRIMPTAPDVDAMLEMSKKVADARQGSLTSAMRPETLVGHATVGLLTST